MDVRPFAPAEGGTTTVANSATVTATVALPYDCDTIVTSNSSATAISFVRVTYYNSAIDAAAAVTGNTGVAASVTVDLPILPGQQIRRYVQGGKHKVFRTIASAADGNIYITPGSGI